MDGNEIKLVTYANNMTSFVCDKQSHITLLDVFKSFGRYSRLMINRDKMEALLLGNNVSNSLDLGKIEIKKSIKILGGYHCEPLRSILSPVNHFLLFSLANTLSKEWHRVLRTNETPDPLNQEFLNLTRFSLFLEGKK